MVDRAADSTPGPILGLVSSPFSYRKFIPILDFRLPRQRRIIIIIIVMVILYQRIFKQCKQHLASAINSSVKTIPDLSSYEGSEQATEQGV